MDATFIHTEIPFKNRFLESIYYFILHMFPKNKFLLERRRKNTEEAAMALKGNRSRHIDIDRVKDLSFDEFVSKYYSKNLPVIIEQGAADWNCTKLWSLKYLADNYPTVDLEILQSKGLVENEYDKSLGDEAPYIEKTVSAKEFYESIEKGEKNYIRFSQLMDIQTDLVKDIDLPWLKKFGATYFGSGYQSFLGSKGRRTPIHSGTNSFFYIMADGSKLWTLYSASSAAVLQPTINKRVYNFTDVDIKNPDEKLYPGFKQLSFYQFELKKGDILFIQAWLYHEVENLTDSWGFNYRFNALYPMFRYPEYMFGRLLFSSPNVFTPIYERSFLSGKKDKGSMTLK